MKRTVSMLTITLLLVSMFTATFSIRAAGTGLSQLTVPDEPAAIKETANLASQESPPTEWNKTYGGTDGENALALVQTVDGGYALAGYTTSFGAGSADAWLVKTDVTGNMQWNRTYGGTSDDIACALVQTVDGGYALAGGTMSFGAGYYDFWLVKTDAAGSMQWNKTYGGVYDDWTYALVQTGDGGYALAGSTSSFVNLDGDVWLVKTDAAGSMQWNKTYGETSTDGACALVQTVDGGYALAGWTASFGAGNLDFWLVKTDVDGNEQWNKTYGGTSEDWANALVQTVDGGYALAGYTTSFGAGNLDFWLVKTDVDGNEQWNKTYGGTSDDYASALVQTVDGGYALAGYTTSFGAGYYDFWLVKTDLAGNTLWNKTYGGTNYDDAWALVQTVDGGYALAGRTYSFGAGSSDFWLVKTAPDSWTGGTIYIRADGSIDPPTAPIQRQGDIYVLTDNIASDPSGRGIVIERDNVTLDGAGYTLQGLGDNGGIMASGRQNVTIKNINIKDFGIAIEAYWSSDMTIYGNHVINNSFGIILDSVNYSRMNENDIAYSGIDICLIDSNHNTISGNNITDTVYGVVQLARGGHNIISDNFFYGCGLEVADSYWNIVVNNFVNGKPLVYLEQVSNYLVSDAGQVILVNCSNITVEKLDLSNTSIGVLLSHTNETKIKQNLMANNGVCVSLRFSNDNVVSMNDMVNNVGGVGIFQSSDCIVSENYLANNTAGIAVSHCGFNNVSGNKIVDNDMGVRVNDASDNFLFHNDFINNTLQVHDMSLDNPYAPPSRNVWDDGYPSGGNYWSNYNGTDLYSGPYQNETGSDGIGDTPYTIDANNTDNFPIVNSWTNTTTSYVNVTKKGITFPVELTTNVTVTDLKETPGSIKLSVSGMTGDSGYVRITQPIGLNSSDIKVFLNNTRLSFPSYDPPASISDNDTHYFIYFMIVFQSTYNVTIWFPMAGDVNADGVVDIFDCVIVAIAFGSKISDPAPPWNPYADINNDGIIDIFDLVVVALRFGETV